MNEFSESAVYCPKGITLNSNLRISWLRITAYQIAYQLVEIEFLKIYPAMLLFYRVTALR